MMILKVILLLFLASAFVMTQDARIASNAGAHDDYWKLVKSAIDSGGPNAADAFSLLGLIDDQQARDLLTSIFMGTGATAVEYASSGLSAYQCQTYLPQLKQVALNPVIQPKVGLVSAIGRANTTEAAQILGAIADQEAQPTAGVAFGILEQMGPLADSILEKEATTGLTPWAPETAASILRRTHRVGAAAAFKLNLVDPDMNVRIAGALGLAQMGISAGRGILEASARNRKSGYWTEALVALAGLAARGISKSGGKLRFRSLSWGNRTFKRGLRRVLWRVYAVRFWELEPIIAGTNYYHGLLGEPRAIKELSGALNDATETAKGRIVWAIARFGGVNLKALTYRLKLEENPAFLSMFVEKLLQPSDPSDLLLLRKEAYSACNDAVGMIALQRLVEAGERTRVSESIRCGLSSNDEHVQQLAVATALNARELWPDLADNISSPVPAVQVGALIAIQKLNQKTKAKLVENY